MKVFYSPYSLRPLKRANRLSSLEPKNGVHLKAELNNKTLFSDYFPHIPLGDRPVDYFLQEFKFQEVEYDKKVFELLLKDHSFQNHKLEAFKNHQLWTGNEEIMGPVVKYKMLHENDENFLKALQDGHTLRIDTNALFHKKSYDDFLGRIPSEFLSKIEYLEDPLKDKNWEGLKIPSARDFIEGTPYDYYIYKPNCEFKPETDKKIIYSAYLGSNLGNYHTYCELMDGADLKLTHGIIGTGFYEDEIHFLSGSYKEGFKGEASEIRKIYREMDKKEWKLLCSM